MAPGAKFLVSARKDLLEEYVALKEPQKAEEFRAESASANSTSTHH
jgi:hypothetical protein